MARPEVVGQDYILDTAGDVMGSRWAKGIEPRQTSTGISDSMVAYVVRHKTNITLLGLFVARDSDALWDLVDEFCDPVDYEYRSVEGGALVLSRNELDLDFSRGAAHSGSAHAEYNVEMSGDLIDAVVEAESWFAFGSAEDNSGTMARILGQDAAALPNRSKRGRKKI